VQDMTIIAGAFFQLRFRYNRGIRRDWRKLVVFAPPLPCKVATGFICLIYCTDI
jgi:hypothetical protein